MTEQEFAERYHRDLCEAAYQDWSDEESERLVSRGFEPYTFKDLADEFGQSVEFMQSAMSIIRSMG